MSPTDVARRHADASVSIVDTAEATALEFWSQVDPDSIVNTWTLRIPDALALTSASQVEAARLADDYVAQAIEAQDIPVKRGPRIRAKAFVGASSGDLLAPMLYQPAIGTLLAIGKGAPPREAMRIGAHQLSTIVRTQVADAGRAADHVALAAQRTVDGYVRVVVGKTCSRCLILAGKAYRWNAGFKRHPRCDCRHLPTRYVEAEDLVQDPRVEYDRLTPKQRRDAGWSSADQRAIAHGADLNRVTNAQRGVYVAGARRFTREAAGRTARLTPDEIFVEAGDNRDEALRLLGRHGYLTDTF